MENYIIKKRNKNKKISKFDFEETGYVFKPNIKSKNLIEITNLSILNVELTNVILNKKLDKSFRKLARIILSVLKDEESNSGDILIALDELAKEKSIITRKYKEYLKKEERDKYLKRLNLLEAQLKEKLFYLNLIEERKRAETMEKGHSR